MDSKRGGGAGGKPQLPAIAAAADMDSRERKISMFRNRFTAHKYSFLFLPSSFLSYRYDTIDEDYGPDSPPVHSPGGIKGTTSPRSVFASSGIDKKPAEPNVDFEFDFKVGSF